MEKIAKTVYDLVVSTVADYDRMRKMIDKGNISQTQTATFTRKLAAIDNALIAVCDKEQIAAREALRLDISQKRGFERGFARSYYTSKNTYESRKREAILLIAKMLELI